MSNIKNLFPVNNSDSHGKSAFQSNHPENTSFKTALAFAGRGFSVFPIQPGSKFPFKGFSWPNLSSNDISQLHSWAEQYPNCNWALDCGKSGLVVLDIDRKPGKDGFLSLKNLSLSLAPGVTVRTPSGGLHYYFTGQCRSSAGKLGPGLDVRGTGGYVLLPGSVNFKHEQPYTLLQDTPLTVVPEKIVELSGAPAQKKENRKEPMVELDLPENIELAKNWLVHAAPTAVEGFGGDSITYKVCCRIRDFSVSEAVALDLLLEHWNPMKATPPWEPHDLERKVRNAFAYANDRPGNAAPGVVFGETGVRGVETDFCPKTITADFNPAALPKRDWIVYGSILGGTVSAIIGPGGVGKSVYSLVLGILISARGPQCETELTGPVRRSANVLVINNEDDQEELERRIAAVLQVYGIQPAELDSKFFYESGYAARRLICNETQDGEVIQTPFVKPLEQYIKANNIGVLVIDPFVSSHQTEENNNTKINNVVQIYKGIAASTKCAIVLVHHTRKLGKEEAPSIEDSRGAKGLTDGCRSGGVVFPLPGFDKRFFGLSDEEALDIIRIDIGKTNYAKRGAGVYFQLESVRIPNGDSVGVPKRIELAQKPEKISDRIAEIAYAAAVAAYEKFGTNEGSVMWSEIKAAFMGLSGLGAVKATGEICLLPNSQDKALRTSFSTIHGEPVFCKIWYTKGHAKTSPIMVHMVPDQENITDDIFA